MKNKLLTCLLTILIFSVSLLKGQTKLTEAVGFHAEILEGTSIWLFPILDDEDKIVVIVFFPSHVVFVKPISTILKLRMRTSAVMMVMFLLWL